MGRPRKHIKDNRLPPRVYKYKYSYVWKPRETGSSITLAPVSGTSMATLWAKYEAEKARQHNVMTVSKLWNLFLASPVFTELAPRTQKDYRQHQRALLGVFGKMKADAVKIEQVRVFMDKRGIESKTQANHELASLSRVYGWGFERGYVKGNPCKGVRKFVQKAREMYISDEWYSAIYDAAILPLRVAMEISYLCAARQGDVMDVEHTDIMDAGLFIEQNKTGSKQIKEWSPRLRAAIALARSAEVTHSKYLICNTQGEKVTSRTINKWWDKARKEAELKLGIKMDCHFHDIKAKGISDYEGSSRDKQLFSGHKTESQVLVYDRKVKVTPSLDAPLIDKVG
ncbi:integrase [Salmonella enterica subsp. enterica]|nr:integrase [Salmonella enterica subsp. enterica]EAW9772769.1 integrase [Salmonella enterica]